jgi:hypothetical protein
VSAHMHLVLFLLCPFFPLPTRSFSPSLRCVRDLVSRHAKDGPCTCLSASSAGTAFPLTGAARFCALTDTACASSEFLLVDVPVRCHITLAPLWPALGCRQSGMRSDCRSSVFSLSTLHLFTVVPLSPQSIFSFHDLLRVFTAYRALASRRAVLSSRASCRPRFCSTSSRS